jgi:hypothetical protein
VALERTAVYGLLVALGEELDDAIELTVVGGGGLAARELDVLGPPPARLAGLGWLREAPTGFEPLPGFEERLEMRRFGPLTVHVASRRDQIHFELFAGHEDHLASLAPTQAELDYIASVS